MSVLPNGAGVQTPASPGRPPDGLTSDPLTPEHRRQLEVESAISPDVIAEEDILSLLGGSQLPAPREELRHPDPDKGEWLGWGKGTKALGPGIYFTNGDQYKPDCPRTVKTKDGKSRTIKYETPAGSRPSITRPIRTRQVLKDHRVPLGITEGDKKALSAVSAGVPTIALSGVDAWCMNVAGVSVPVPDWDEIAIQDRLFLLMYDSDAATKPEVLGAERRLIEMLESRGGRVLVVRIPAGPNGEKQGIDDFRAAGGDLRALINAALLAAIGDASRPAAPSCQDCAEKDHTIEKLNGYLSEYRAADELVKHGPFTPDGAQVHRHLVDVANAARRNGKQKIPLLREDVARLALGSTGPTAEKAVSRALKAYKPYQDDPELLATIPYRLEWDERGRKTHIDLVPLTPETPQTKEQQYRALAHLPHDRKPPAKVRDRDDGCPRCHGPEGVESRTVKRCRSDACGHTWHTRPVILGRAVAEPVETIQRPIPLLVAALPGQIVPANNSGTKVGQIVPANGPHLTLVPAPFVAREDMEAAASPHYEALPPPDDPPPACVRSGCREPAANGYTCVEHLQADALIGGIAGGSE